jgi:hypothetical protein
MKVETAVNIEEKLFKLLKQKAASEKKSISAIVEQILRKSFYKVPNAETLQAISDVENNRNLEVIDDLDAFLKSI